MKALAAELDYDLEISEDVIAQPDEALEKVAGGKKYLKAAYKHPLCKVRKGAPCWGRIILRQPGLNGQIAQRYRFKCRLCGQEWDEVYIWVEKK